MAQEKQDYPPEALRVVTQAGNGSAPKAQPEAEDVVIGDAPDTELTGANQSPGGDLANQRRRLAELDVTIGGGLQTFFSVGNALLEIRESRLYLVNGYKDFDDYCERKWGATARRMRQISDGAKVYRHLEERNSCSDFRGRLPENECQVRPLTKFKNDPETVVQVWDRAVAQTQGAPVTGKVVGELAASMHPTPEKREKRHTKLNDLTQAKACLAQAEKLLQEHFEDIAEQVARLRTELLEPRLKLEATPASSP